MPTNYLLLNLQNANKCKCGVNVTNYAFTALDCINFLINVTCVINYVYSQITVHFSANEYPGS